MKIRKAVPLAKYKWLSLFDIRFVDKTGRERSWQIASRGGEPKCISGRFEPADAVVVVPHHIESGKLVVIREFRVPLGDYEYGFPAGLIDPGETPAQAAERELTEETGLSVVRFVKISPPVYSTAGISDESVVMAFVECTGTPTTRFTTASESIEVLLVDPAEAQALCGTPGLKFDAKAWLVISHFAAGGRV